MEESTIAAYEAGAVAWRDHRPARFLDRVEALSARLADGDGIVADLGCGAGLHLPYLPRPAVALDASAAMLDLVPEVAPEAWRVRADLAHLPFRRAALSGAWARASYLHVPSTSLPWALMELHHALEVDGAAHLTMLRGDEDGPQPDDEYPGRFFARWQPDRLSDQLTGAGLDVLELVVDRTEEHWLHALVRRARTLPDVVGPGMRLLLCGLNPSVYSADAGVGFARPGNRFWPAATSSGLLTTTRDARDAYVRHAVGMTDLVKRATARADELAPDEYRAGAARVERLVHWLRPGAICFVGLSGYRVAVDRRATAGVQDEPFGGVPAYVMPNPSGLNAHTSPADLAEHLRAAARLADDARSRESDPSAVH
ncbi:MAG: uracil-DNA glycosylase family protein [Acidimicrobiia bacterium]